MRSSTPTDLHNHCDRCLFRKVWCLCPFIPLLKPTLEVIIVRHHKERMKTSNTGRIASLALQNSLMLDYGIRDIPLDPAPFAKEDTWLLFPAREGEAHELPLRPPKRLVVLDGTWRQAKRIAHRIKELEDLPRMTLPPPQEYPERLRRAPHPWALSTIEAIASAINLLDDPAIGEDLNALFAIMVKRFRAQRGWPKDLPHSDFPPPRMIHTSSECSYTSCHCGEEAAD